MWPTIDYKNFQPQESTKNQKPITQFFKTTTESSVNNNVKSEPVNTNEGVLTRSECLVKPVKRKSSPSKLDINITEKLIRKDSQNVLGAYSDTNKKLKSDNDNHLTLNSDVQHMAVKKSPKKENLELKKKTHINVSDAIIKVKSEKHTNDGSLFSKDGFQPQKERYPLTPVSVENSINDLLENHEVKVRTPVKLSSQNSCEGNKRSSEKKKKSTNISPLQGNLFCLFFLIYLSIVLP